MCILNITVAVKHSNVLYSSLTMINSITSNDLTVIAILQHLIYLCTILELEYGFSDLSEKFNQHEHD